jgi:hypothetical protein
MRQIETGRANRDLEENINMKPRIKINHIVLQITKSSYKTMKK